MPPLTLSQAFALAQQHHHAQRFADAEHVYRQILAVAPGHADAQHFLGLALWQSGRRTEGLEWMQRSITTNPRNAAYHDNLGTAYRDLGRLEEAIACSRRALALDAAHPDSHNNLGNVLQETSHVEEAVACYERALLLDPNSVAAYAGLGSAYRFLGRIADAGAAYRRALQLNPGDLNTHSGFLLNLQYRDDIDDDTMFAEHLRWDELHARPLQREIRAHDNDPTPDRRLRIGYVSPDFCSHPVGFFIEGLLAAHDPALVEVFCYSEQPKPDAVTARCRQAAHHWRETAGWTDAQIAARVREDRIDILVDLAGHTQIPRLLVFARKPAPVQVTYLGYCNTTGMQAMDYRLTDAIADPPGTSDRFYTERLIRLPDCFACFRPHPESPAVAPSPAIARGCVTFASFHLLAKANARMLGLWAEILRNVPESRLLISSGEPQTEQRLRAAFAAHGINAARLEFRPWQALPKYLAMHSEVDVLLDTHPFSGHTVSCHALWMGVPVVTLAGTAHRSRMVASVLNTAGLSELIAHSPEEYVRLATGLGRDPQRLAEMRSTLRQRVAASPLVDAPRFAKAVEAAYREMWTTWCERERQRAPREAIDKTACHPERKEGA